MARSNLQRAIDALEDEGFHVDRAYEEDYRDAGNSDKYAESKTGAICLRITPVEGTKKKED
jgi:biotin operon repressor